MSGPRLAASTLRGRLVLAFTALVTVAIVMVGGISYFATVDAYRGELDRSLASAATTIADGGTVSTSPTQDTRSAQRADEDEASGPILTVAQRISPDGTATAIAGSALIPTDRSDVDLAASGPSGESRYGEVTINGTDYRTYTLALGDGDGAILVARDLSSANRTLTEIAINTAFAGASVIVLAVLAGWWLARQISRRLVGLTVAAEQVAQTGDLSVFIDTAGRDEVGSLGTSLRTMLAQLREAKDAQQRLLQNAGHELRTPITSLRTNATVLRRFDDIAPDDRGRLLDDIDSELRDLTGLVNELIELATDTRGTETQEATNVGALVARAAARSRRRTGRTITVLTDDTILVAAPRSLARAVENLVENAAKFDTSDNSIEVTVAGNTIEVADRGPGVPEYELTQIFDRFHRADTARTLPGSGLGLAIVREVAEQHNGAVRARLRDGGGLVVTLTLHRDPPTKT